MKTKKCAKCKEYINVDLFFKNKICKDGLDAYCKECHKEISREQYKKDKLKYVFLERGRIEYDIVFGDQKTFLKHFF